MDGATYCAALRRDGDLLARAAQAGLDAPIPTCPDWQMRDLVRHLGFVHRWVTANVAQCRTRPMSAEEEEALVPDWPADADLVAWFREGLAGLIHTLATAASDLACWSFLPAPSPLLFWARRQAHETAIHRVDAESAVGQVSPFPATFAADGLDELLFGFVSRPGEKLRLPSPRTLSLAATDIAREWQVRIESDRVVVRSEAGQGDCLVRGPATDLYLLLWNRRPLDGLEIAGDAGLLDHWRQSVRITWS